MHFETDHRHELISTPSLSLVWRVTSRIEAVSIVLLETEGHEGDNEREKRCVFLVDYKRLQRRIDTHV